MDFKGSVMGANDFTVKRLVAELREGRSTSIGSYPKFFITADGGSLSFEAVRDNIMTVARATRDGFETQWCVVGCDVNWEDPALFCDHTGKRIESAYAEDEVEV
jgi:hypothetical protein